MQARRLLWILALSSLGAGACTRQFTAHVDATAPPVDAAVRDATVHDAAPDGAAPDGQPPDAAPQDAAPPDAATDAAVEPDATPAACGDGRVDAAESCDDGNLTGGDGCSASCQVEPGFHCSGQPSVCNPICGDGLILGDERCDDGNTVNGDGCDSSCRPENLPVLRWRGSSSTWYSRTLTFDTDPEAPTSSEYPIVAAAIVQQSGLALVFTRTTWHELDLGTRRFNARGTLAAKFPEVTGTSLHAALGAAQTNPADLYLYVGSYAYLYQYNYQTRQATYVDNYYLPTHWSNVCCGGTIPTASQIKADWVDLDNALGWVNQSLGPICGLAGDVTVYGAHLTTSNNVHLQDLSCSDTFFDVVPYGSFPAFSNALAPNPNEIRAAFYDTIGRRLYVITQQ